MSLPLTFPNDAPALHAEAERYAAMTAADVRRELFAYALAIGQQSERARRAMHALDAESMNLLTSKLNPTTENRP